MRSLDHIANKARTSEERTAHAIRTLHVARINGMFCRGEIDAPMAAMLLESAGLNPEGAEQLALNWHAVRTVGRLGK